MKLTHLALAGACLTAATQTNAATILIDAGQFDASIQFYTPIGQSFVAIDSSLTSIGFAFSDLNPASPNNPITLNLVAGAGVGGSVVATRSMTLPAVLPSTSATPQFIDFDFSGVGLTIGQTYTAVLSATSPKVAVVYGPSSYAAGQSYYTGTLSACATSAACDLNLRVIGTTGVGAIPEPATWAMLLGGFGLAGGAMRRRARPAARTARARDIVATTLDGRQPAKLTRQRLARIGELPTDCGTRPELLRFAGA